MFLHSVQNRFSLQLNENAFLIREVGEHDFTRGKRSVHPDGREGEL